VRTLARPRGRPRPHVLQARETYRSPRIPQGAAFDRSRLQEDQEPQGSRFSSAPARTLADIGRIRSQTLAGADQCRNQSRLLIEAVAEEDLDRVPELILINFRRIEFGFELALSSVFPAHCLLRAVCGAGNQQRQDTRTDVAE